MKIIFTSHERYIQKHTDIFTIKEEEVEDVSNGACRFRPIARHGLATRRPRMFYPSLVRAKVYLYKVQEIYADRAYIRSEQMLTNVVFKFTVTK